MPAATGFWHSLLLCHLIFLRSAALFRFTPKTEFGHHGIRAEYALVADKYPDRPLSPVYRSGDKRTGGRLVAALPHVQKTEGLEPGYFLVRALANGGYNILDAKTGNVLKSTGPRTVEFVQQSRLKDYRSRMAAEFKLERTTKRELKHMLCYLRRTKPRPSQKSNSSSGDSKRQGTRT